MKIVIVGSGFVGATATYAIGEHGNSETLTWSIVSIGGIPLNDFCRERKITLSEPVKESTDNSVRRSAYNIIKEKGATYYGIGSALARIVDVILNDKRAILTIYTLQTEVEKIPNVTLSLPRLVEGNGIIASIPLSLNSREKESLGESAETIKKVTDALKN